MYDSPFVHFRVAASFVLFAPVVGSTIGRYWRVAVCFHSLLPSMRIANDDRMRLVGVVNKQSSDHIGLLVYGIFNASIPSAAIRDAFSWHEQEQAWVLDATGEVVDHGCAMRLVVDKAVVEQEVLGLSGSLLDAKLTGFCGGEDDTDVGSMKHGGHAEHAEHRAHAEHQEHVASPATPSSTISPAKKRKNESAADASISSSSSKKSKKKDAAKESIDETTAVADAVDAAVLNVKATAAVKESKEKKARKEKRKSAVSVAE